MKKLLVVLFIIYSGSLFARDYKIVNFTATADTGETVVSDSVFVGSYDKIGIGINYDETDAGGVVSGVVSILMGDGDTWYTGYVCDNTGTDSPITSVTFTADGTKLVNVPAGLAVGWIKISTAVTGATSTSTATIDGYIMLQAD